MSPIDLLLSATPYILLDSQGNTVEVPNKADSVQFAAPNGSLDESKFTLNTPSGYKDYSLAAVLLFALSQSIPNANYLETAAAQEVQIISFADRSALNSIAGPSTADRVFNQTSSGSNLNSNSMDIDSSTQKRNVESLDKSKSSHRSTDKAIPKPSGYEILSDSTNVPDGAKRLKGELIYEKGSKGYEIYGYQQPLFDRTSIMDLPDDKNLEHIAKTARGILSSAKKANGNILRKVQEVSKSKPTSSSKTDKHKSSSDHKSKSSSHKSSKPGIPIIIVPNAIQSLITLFNIEQFLIEGVYVPMDTISDTFNKPDRVVLERKLPSGHIGGSRFPKVYHIIDSADNLKPEDWQNVVATFVTGQPWQFKYWRYHDPIKLFDRVKGFNLRYVGDPLSDQVQKWAVKPLQVHRRQRHNDKQAVQSFWEEVDDFIMKKKRDVFAL